MRTRGAWNRQGYAVLIPDTVAHFTLRGQRSSAHYAHLVADIIAFVRKQDLGPVFLLGTSQGAIAAVNGTSHATSGDIVSTILTESVSVMKGSEKTVFSADPTWPCAKFSLNWPKAWLPHKIGPALKSWRPDLLKNYAEQRSFKPLQRH